MKKLYKIILKLLVLCSMTLGGVCIPCNEALAIQIQGGIRSGTESFSKTGEQDNKPLPTDSKMIEDDKLSGIPQVSIGGPKKTKTQAVEQIYNKFALRGTVVENKDYALAIIEDKALQSQKVYKIGHSIYGGMITDIQRERVIIRLHGKDLVFKMGGGSHSGNEDMKPKLDEEKRVVTVSFKEIQEAFDALIQPTSGARLARRSPGIETGNGGLQLSSVEPGSVFEKMGFKEGDVIDEINGNPIKDPYNAVAMYDLMKSVLPGDIFSQSGLDLRSFLNRTDNQMRVLLQKMQKLFHLFGKNGNAQLTLTVKRGGRRR